MQNLYYFLSYKNKEQKSGLFCISKLNNSVYTTELINEIILNSIGILLILIIDLILIVLSILSLVLPDNNKILIKNQFKKYLKCFLIILSDL